MDDLERRLNPLFDALNCETLPEGVVEKLLVMTQGALLFLVFDMLCEKEWTLMDECSDARGR